MNEIKLGIPVKDKLTDLEGTTIAKIEYLYGCIQYQVQPKELKDGKPIGNIWIDEAQLINKEKKVEQKSDDEEMKIEDMEDNLPLDKPERNYGGNRNHP